MKPSWMPYDFPKDTHTVYWNAVSAVQKFKGDLERLDSWIPLIAHMYLTNEYDDASLKPHLIALGPSAGLAHTLRTMPDICLHVLYLKMWKTPEDLMAPPEMVKWADLLTLAIPIACKGRNLAKNFAKRVIKHPPVYDFVMRVFLGAMLGVFGGKVAPFWTRVFLYGAFVLNKPSNTQLASFILNHKLVARICIESFIFYSMKQTPLHDYLVDNYTWQYVFDNRFKALEVLQDQLVEIACDAEFLKEPVRWLEVEKRIEVLNKDMTPHCFRPVTTSFSDDLIKEAMIVWRQDKPESLVPPFDLRVFRQIWSLPQDNLDVRIDQIVPVGLKASTLDALEKAKRMFYMEQKMTGAQHLMSGTPKKPFGLYHEDRPEFFRVLGFAMLASMRLSVRWGHIPKDWTERQMQALGPLLPDDGVYFVCPLCCEIRSRPVTWPEGKNHHVAAKGRYKYLISTDLGSQQHYCVKYSKNLIKKRGDDFVLEDDTETETACIKTPLLRICMIGLVLYTKGDGNLVLCVDCGTLVKLTRECMSKRGPTCGCTLKEAPTGPKIECEACGKEIHSRSRKQQFRVFDSDTGEVCNITLCQAHKANWISKYAYMFTKKEAIRAIRKNKYARMIHGTPVFYKKKLLS